MLVTLVGIVTLVSLEHYERTRPDGGDRQAIDRVGDVHVTRLTDISREGYRAVVGRECELGLHCSGLRQQRQEQQLCGMGDSCNERISFEIYCCLSRLCACCLMEGEPLPL